MTINDEIHILANQLANAGKKPTVALVKTKLNKQVALPTIISALKVWQHDPTLISIPKDKSDKNEKSDKKIKVNKTNSTVETDLFRQNINDELAQIKHEIIELKQLVKQLIEQKKANT
jgi:hypothetical protein